MYMCIQLYLTYMYVSVMEMSCYKERFTFADPLSMTSASRTTRYRTRKRRIVPQEPSEGKDRNAVTTQYADSVEFECGFDLPVDEEVMPDFNDNLCTSPVLQKSICRMTLGLGNRLRTQCYISTIDSSMLCV